MDIKLYAHVSGGILQSIYGPRDCPIGIEVVLLDEDLDDADKDAIQKQVEEMRKDSTFREVF